MTPKEQDTQAYRGLVWVGRFYRAVSWIGLVASVLSGIFAFFVHMRNMWFVTYMPRTDILLQSVLLGLLIMVLGLILSAIGFGVGVGIQVGLTLMTNTEIKTQLLRRMAQEQSQADSVLRLQDPDLDAETDQEKVQEFRRSR